MRPVVLCFCFMLCIYLPRMEELPGAAGQLYAGEEPPGCYLQEDQLTDLQIQEDVYSPMEALDIVKENYAANFTRQKADRKGYYFYKLSGAEYYLEYEGTGATEEEYIIHLYEYVLDDPTENLGHTVTYGWYRVDRRTGEIKEQDK